MTVLREPTMPPSPGEPFAPYAEGLDVNWSDELEALHEESSREHFLDVWTRTAILDAVRDHVPARGVVVDAGCSSGYLLEDLRRELPHATLVGVDLVMGGLRRAHALVPDAELALADVCDLPLDDGAADAVVSANLLEHVPDDVAALRELARILRPGGRVAIVVPAGPGTYDYYDAFLGHERRYGRGELARKARSAGLVVERDTHLGALIYPAFWTVKKLNRVRHRSPGPDEARRLVERDIDRTGDSRVGAATTRVERAVLRRGVGVPFGIRGLTVLRRGT